MNSKKTFICVDCGKEYQANWTKGRCPTCRVNTKRKEYAKKHYTSTDPYGHYANHAISREPGDWLGVNCDLSPYCGYHPIRERENIRAYNDLKRRYYRGEL